MEVALSLPFLRLRKRFVGLSVPGKLLLRNSSSSLMSLVLPEQPVPVSQETGSTLGSLGHDLIPVS